MKKIILTIVLATLCLFFKAKAQFYKPSEKTIRMGETLPKSFYQTIHHAVNTKTDEATTLQLEQYRNKLIILDFWATWCGPCIYSLNKLDSLQKTMKNDNFIIVPVTYQSAKEIITVVNKFKWNMTTLVSDTTLAQIFPHSGIPHQVWIKDGKVLAIPKWDYATDVNITKVINGNDVKVVMNIQDRVVDPLRQMFINENGTAAWYHKTKNAVIARYIKDHRFETLTYLSNSDTTILYCINNNIKQLFYGAFKDQIFPTLDIQSGILWDITDSLKHQIINIPRKSLRGNHEEDLVFSKWRDNNLYSYNLRYPKLINKTEALLIMKEHLRFFSGIYLNLDLTIETRPQKYLVLRTTVNKSVSIDLLASKGGKERIDIDNNNYRVYNRPFGEQFLLLLKGAEPVKGMTIIDSTGISKALAVDFIMPKATMNNLKKTQKSIMKYGLVLKEETLMVPLLVVKQKNRYSY